MVRSLTINLSGDVKNMIPTVAIKGANRENHTTNNAANDEKKQSPSHGAYKESYAGNHAACYQYTLLTITLSPRRKVQQMHATTQGKNTITVMKRFGLNRNFSIVTDLVNCNHQHFPCSVHLNTCIYCDRYHIVIQLFKQLK